MSDAMGVRCGNCGGNVYMATCNCFRGTGHEWVLVSICMVCRAVHWTQDGCLDCQETEGVANGSHPEDGDGNTEILTPTRPVDA